MKRVLKILAGMIVALAVIIIIAIITLPHFIKIDTYQEYIQSFLESATGQDIDIGTIGLSLWKGLEIYMTDVQIKEKQQGIIQPMFKAEKISARISFWSLLHKKIRLGNIIVHSPEINYRATEGNPFASLLMLSKIGTLVEQGSQDSSLRKEGKEAKSTFLSGFSFDSSGLGKVEAKKGTIQMEKKLASGEMLTLRLERVFFDIDGLQDPSSFSIDAKASFPQKGGQLNLKGTLGPIEERGKIPLNLFFDADISKGYIFSKSLSSLVGIGIEKGQVKVKSEIGGTLGGKVNIQGEGAFENLSLKGAAPEAYLNRPLKGEFSFQANMRKAVLNIEEINVRIGHSVITMSGTVDLKKSMPMLKFSIKGEAINYSDMENLLPLFSFQPPSYIDGGTLYADLNGNVKLESFLINELSGDAVLEDFGIKIESLPSPIKNINCQVKISKNNLDLSNLEATFLESKIDGNIHIKNFESPVSTFDLGVFGGHARGGLTFPKGEKERYTLNIRVEGIDVNSFISLLSPPNQNIIHGHLEGNMQLESKDLLLETLSQSVFGDGNFKVVNGRIATFGLLKQVSLLLNLMGGKGIGKEETPFEFLEGQFHLANGNLEINDLFLKSADIELKGQGTFQVDSNIDFSFNASFSPEVSNAMVASTPLLRYGVDSNGRLSFPLRISGNITHPKVLLDLDNILKQSTKKKLLNKIKDFFQK